MRPKQPVLPMAPLFAVSGLGRATTSIHPHGGTFDHPAGQTYLAELVGVNIRSVVRWIADGIPLSRAEDVCDILGLHPYEVWPLDYLEAVSA